MNGEDYPFQLFELALPTTNIIIGDRKLSLLNWGEIRPEIWNNSLHNHSYYEACYSFSGEGMHVLNGKSSTIKSGNWFFSAPGENHQMFSDKNIPWGIFCMYFSLLPVKKIAKSAATEIEADLIRNFLNTLTRTWEGSKQSLILCNLLSNEIKEQQNGFEKSLEGLAATLFIDVMRSLNIKSRDNIEPFAYHGDSERSRVQKAIRFIEANIERDLHVKDIAAHIFVSERQLDRIFKKAFLESPLQIIIRIKVNIALQLLSGTELSIKEISQKCGFKSHGYFTKTFRKHTGITAGMFRHNSINFRDFSCGYAPVKYMSKTI